MARAFSNNTMTVDENGAAGGGAGGGGEDEDDGPAAAGSRPVKTLPSALPPSILLVDDAPVIQIMVKIVLERNGFTVDTALNGREALERMGKRDYDVVVCDLLMPVLGGLEMTSEVRAQEAKLLNVRHQRVIIMSGNSSQEDIELALSTGADDFMSKPAAPDVMVRKIRKLLHSV